MDGNFGLLFKGTGQQRTSRSGLLKNKAKCGMCIKSVPWSLKAALQATLPEKGAVLKLQKILFMMTEETALLQEFKIWVRFSSRFINLLWFTTGWQRLKQGDIKTGLARRFMASESNSLTNVKSWGQLKISRQKGSRGQVLHWCFGDSIPKYLLLQQFPFLKLLQRAHRCYQRGKRKTLLLLFYFKLLCIYLRKSDVKD